MLSNKKLKAYWSQKLASQTDLKVPTAPEKGSFNSLTKIAPGFAASLACLPNRRIKLQDKVTLPHTAATVIKTNDKSIPVYSVKWGRGKSDQLLATVSEYLCIWDGFNQNLLRKLPLNQHLMEGTFIRDIGWSQDGHCLYSASLDSEMIAWDVEMGIPITTIYQDEPATTLMTHPTNPHLIIVGLLKDGLRSFDLRSGKMVQSFKGKFGRVNHVQFLNDSQIVSTADVLEEDGLVVWDFISGKALSNAIYPAKKSCLSLAVNPNQQEWAARCINGQIMTFSTNAPYQMNKKKFKMDQVDDTKRPCIYSPKGILMSTTDTHMYLWTPQMTKIHAKGIVDASWTHSLVTGNESGELVFWEHS